MTLHLDPNTPPRPVVPQPVDPRTIPVFAPFTDPECRHWVPWDYEWRVNPTTGVGVWTKPPFKIDGKSHASNNKPDTWANFDEVWAAVADSLPTGTR